ncbi:hypothetical protein H1R20_g6035, partial [Candolleomyces eurysporus]
MADELAEINGIKPNVLLEDGEQREVGSATSKSVYKVKRTFDHYFCSCPAWRNQSGMPVNARSCKHLKSFLGEAYELARIELKNPGGAAAAGGAKKPASKAKAPAAKKEKAPPKPKKAPAKKKKVEEEEEDEEEDEEDEEEEEEVKPKKAAPKRAAAAAKAPAAKGKGRAKVKKEEDEDEDEDAMDVEDDVKPAGGAKADPNDELAEINGIKPKVVLVEGEEHEVKSATSKSVYKVKRTLDHYYCTCPAWRNQKGVEVNARTCKHLQSFLGEEYEAARIVLRGGAPPASKAKPASKAAAKKPASKAAASKPASKAKAAPKRGAKVKKEEDLEEEDEEEDAGEEEEDVKPKPAAAANPDDELAEINGIQPKVFLVEGEEHEVKSATSKSVYKVKRTFDHYYCTCPAWRNQKGVETNARTCKHLQAFLGEEYEAARLALRNGGAAPASKAKPASKAAAAKKPASTAKKPASTAKKPASKATATKPASKAAGSKRKKADEDEDEEDEEGDEEPEKRAKVEETIKEEDEDEEMDDAEEKGPVDGDELAEIDGHKPKVYMADGDEREVKSATSSSTYKVKRTWDHYYCTCPAWRNQGGAPTNARTCKHLQALLGADYEAARLMWKNPNGPVPKAPKSKGKAAAKGKGKAKKADGEEGEEEEGEGEGLPGLLLAQKWDIEDGPDPKGWWVSEKLDGVRTYYDGKGGFFSRLGNPFTPPQWFIDTLPKGITLDGELFAGRGQFQSAVSIVKTINSPHWKGISFQVFDVPSKGEEPFETRIEFLKGLFGENGSHVCEHVKVVEHLCVRDRDHVMERLKEVENAGGEGVMLRRPKSQYEGTRSSSLLKVKTFFDAEAIVTGHAPGKGKHEGATGALKCKMASGKTFNVGSGLSDKQRKNPPKIGSIIVYRFQELTRDGVPRFPTFVGEAADKTEPKDAEIPEARKGGAAKE